ncbi:MAG TPA: NUDIX hydrolase [Gammaproteobacteria bacterium]|nr:NUDIX hydrolase [Gammaproteobacteria bacterium]
MVWKPDVTVAAVIEREGRFLLVEERVSGRVVFNQPAGHVEDGETLRDAVIRETLEETAWHFEPDALIGIYLWKSRARKRSFLRIAFSGACHAREAQQPLDEGILRAVWLSREQLAAQHGRLRSPMVLRCIDDYLSGARYPQDLLTHLDIEAVSARAAIL